MDRKVGKEKGDGDGANRRRARELSSKLSALTAFFCHHCVSDTRKRFVFNFFFFSFLLVGVVNSNIIEIFPYILGNSIEIALVE